VNGKNNPLLLDPVFARQYIQQRHSWLIDKQSLCAKCRLQLGKHLLDHQAQNAANQINISEQPAINCQCHHYQCDNESDLISDNQFDDLTSKDLIKLQQALHAQKIKRLKHKI
jgi:hypothetical protein